MNQDIHSHLEKLKTELNKLEPAVRHLQKADENATALILTLSNIHKEFSKHLENIEKSVSEANKQHQEQLRKNIQESINQINIAAAQLAKSNSEFEIQIKKLLREYDKLGASTTILIKEIDKIDFPFRLDKLDATVSSINQGLQNTQTRIGDLERNVKDDIQAKSKEILSKAESSENAIKKSMADYFLKQAKENRLLKILLFVSLGLTIGLIIFQIIFSL